ncbi:MAG: MYXO-CTERM sorting domain-containing protein [Nannocystaceae bacterium]
MIDNGTAVEESDCELSPQVKLLWTFVADPPGLVAPDAPEFDVTYTVEDSPHAFEDAEIVCCSKESFPFEYIGCGLELGEQCASTLGFGILRADIRVDPATWDPQGQIVLEDVEVGATTALRESVEPFCVTPTAIHLATGERAAGSSICPDPALVAEVGEKALDPAEILPCRPLWTCDNGDLGWDPDSCRRWRAGGCACAAGDGGDEPSTLALAVLVIALGRRRARMESRPIPVTGRE